MGQNVITALPLLVAEELEIDLKEITVETLPYKASNAGNYTTWASGSIKGTWMQMRYVGATAKFMLIKAAADQWKVPVEDCKAQDGTVINIKNNKVLNYKDLLKEASALTPPEKPPLKNIKDFKYIGSQITKTNITPIITGKYSYTMDVKLPDMLYASLVRCPVYSGKVKSWDDSALKGLAGIVKVIQVDQIPEALNRNAVAVIATNTWAALEGKRLLKVKWSYELGKVHDNQSLTEQFKTEFATAKPARVYGKDKNAPFKTIDGPGVYEATYEAPYLAHTTLEPVNCTARYKDGKFEIWGGFQAPMFINNVLPKVFGIDSSAISVNLMPMGGSFGRKEKIDNVAEAMVLTKALGVPVQNMFDRTDDIQADFYRPASHHHLAATGTKNEITKWRDQYGITTFPGKEISGPWDSFGGVTNDLCYPVSDYQSAFYPVESPIPIGSWRSISFSQNVFVVESFIDELAVHYQIDPIKYRLNLFNNGDVKDNARLKNVMLQCAEKIGWDEKPANGHFRGIAVCPYGRSGAVAAHAMEISVSKDKLVKIHRCVAAVDCGLVVDPDGLKAQIEGSLVWALSGMFNNEITVKNGMVDQQSYNDYRVLRMNEMPPFEILLIAGEEKPDGGGEPSVPSVAPALCNAIYAATGFRVRELPIKKHGFRLV
ncbi:molybdopterin cofactor-binding domain-containing protein [Mucilaginibacter sp.]|uniref:xanthine dehydrogenase family protein molybdopterin-binding subunit n=1 Tax=Mucilaginibacter sp. TaxID=1882438 RepID=UPI003B00AC79